MSDGEWWAALARKCITAFALGSAIGYSLAWWLGS